MKNYQLNYYTVAFAALTTALLSFPSDSHAQGFTTQGNIVQIGPCIVYDPDGGGNVNVGSSVRAFCPSGGQVGPYPELKIYERITQGGNLFMGGAPGPYNWHHGMIAPQNVLVEFRTAGLAPAPQFTKGYSFQADDTNQLVNPYWGNPFFNITTMPLNTYREYIPGEAPGYTPALSVYYSTTNSLPLTPPTVIISYRDIQCDALVAATRFDNLFYSTATSMNTMAPTSATAHGIPVISANDSGSVNVPGGVINPMTGINNMTSVMTDNNVYAAGHNLAYCKKAEIIPPPPPPPGNVSVTPVVPIGSVVTPVTPGTLDDTAKPISIDDTAKPVAIDSGKK
jgi:hypothetical protein